jgi:hypothetical protein
MPNSFRHPSPGKSNNQGILLPIHEILKQVQDDFIQL